MTLLSETYDKFGLFNYQFTPDSYFGHILGRKPRKSILAKTQNLNQFITIQ